MIDSNMATLVRPKLMADNSKRIELDFGETVKLADFDDLIGVPLKVIIIPLDDYKKLEKQL